MLKRILKWAGLLVLFVVLTVIGVGWWLHEPRPEGQPGEAAERMARRMTEAVDAEAWAGTGAVRWNFGGRNEHLWDRERGLSRVRWGDVEVLQWLDRREGRAYQGGKEVTGERARELIDAAYERWVNDSFWLNPVVKCFDPGTKREIAYTDEGDKGLLVTYTSGGLTPGDAYLWLLDSKGLPIAWKMWVSVIPMGGVEATWDGWTKLATGARVSTEHEIGPERLVLRDVQGGRSWRDLAEHDPFARLLDGGD